MHYEIYKYLMIIVCRNGFVRNIYVFCVAFETAVIALVSNEFPITRLFLYHKKCHIARKKKCIVRLTIFKVTSASNLVMTTKYLITFTILI